MVRWPSVNQEKQMAFILRYNDQGLACPRIQCDACKEIINDPEEANVAWKEAGDSPQIYTLC
jgi:hypothetical protein